MEFQFLSNTIQTTDYPIRIAIAENDFHLRIFNLKFTTAIDCSYRTQFEYNTFLQQYGDTIYFRLDKTLNNKDSYQSLSNIMNNICALSSATIAIIATSAILLLILIIAITVVFYRFLMKHHKPRPPLSLVIPEGKTYRETQIIFQVENAGLLKTDL